MSVGSSRTIMGYVFRILELQFIILRLPSNTCLFNSSVSIDVCFLSFTSHSMCQLLNYANFCVSKVKNLKKLCQTYILLGHAKPVYLRCKAHFCLIVMWDQIDMRKWEGIMDLWAYLSSIQQTNFTPYRFVAKSSQITSSKLI